MLGMASDFLLKHSVFMRYLLGGSGSLRLLLPVLTTLLVADMELSLRRLLILEDLKENAKTRVVFA